MRRNFKKAMSAVLVAAMTFGTPIAVNQNVTVAEAADKPIVSDPAYFYDFEGDNPFANKGTVENVADAKIVGDGVVKEDSTNHYFDNASEKESAGGDKKGSNYLSLPADIIKTIHKSKSHAVTVSMNLKAVDGKYAIWSPVLAMDSVGNPNSWPCLAFEIRGTAVWNSAGWFNGDNTGTDAYTAAYADGNWHTLTIVLTETTITGYMDGKAVVNTTGLSAINGENGTYGIFDNGNSFIEGIDRVALGGNQPFWADTDAQICYDDVAIFDKALSTDEITALADGDYVFNRTLPFSVSVNGKTELTDEKMADGTIYWSTIKDVYHYGDTVQIEVDANKGVAPSMTVVNKATGDEVATKVVSLDNGKLAVEFTMPASDVEITKYSFGDINTDELEAEIASAKTVYDNGNDSAISDVKTIYTTESWKAFTDAYDNAVDVVKNVKEKTQVDLDNAIDGLKKAVKGLTYCCTVSITTKDSLLSSGKTIQIESEIKSNSETAVTGTFTSSDEAVATVDENGLVTGVAAGTAKITLKTADGTSDSVKVKVLGDSQVILGSSADYNFAPVTDTAAWTSSDETVATVKAGKVTAVATGSAVIGVTTADNILMISKLM